MDPGNRFRLVFLNCTLFNPLSGLASMFSRRRYHPLPPIPLIPPSCYSCAVTSAGRWQQRLGPWIPRSLHYDWLYYVKHLKCLIMPSAGSIVVAKCCSRLTDVPRGIFTVWNIFLTFPPLNTVSWNANNLNRNLQRQVWATLWNAGGGWWRDHVVAKLTWDPCKFFLK